MNEINETVVSYRTQEIEPSNSEYLSCVSQEFERDSRRYNRAFTEESEVGVV